MNQHTKSLNRSLSFYMIIFVILPVLMVASLCFFSACFSYQNECEMIKQYHLDSEKSFITSEITHAREQIKKHQVRKISILCLILIFTLFLIKYFIFKIQSEIQKFSGLFDKAVNKSIPIDLKMIHYQEFISLADNVNKMIQTKEKAYYSLRKSEKNFRYLTVHSQDLIMHFDTDLQFLYVNPVIKTFSSVSPETCIGKKLDVAGFTEDVFIHFQKSLKYVIETKKIHRLEMQFSENIYLDCMFIPELDDQGSVLSVISSSRDITAYKRIEEERIKAQKELQKQRNIAIRSDRLRALGEMSASMAHELNQPLVGVRGLAEHILIAQDRGWILSPQDIRKKAELIIEQADRMTHVIQHVRTFAREAGQTKKIPTDINQVINSCLDLIGALLQSKMIHTELMLNESLPQILINPFSLEEALLNIISNAKDALNSKRLKNDSEYSPVLNIRTQIDDSIHKKIIIEIEDNGIGIPEKNMGKIYDPFFTTKEAEKKMGLGLSICQTLIEGSRGQLHIDSIHGQWTKVTIAFPIQL